jgi:undecaprenyl phosphate-alpha-L-ara4N flippase subunit ArnE
MLPYYLMLATAIAGGAAGQIALKTGAARSTDHLGQFTNPFTLLGFGFYFISAMLYIASIKKIPVSLAYPSVAISYVVVSYAAHLLWGEPFGAKQLIALLLIGGGILVLYR